MKFNPTPQSAVFFAIAALTLALSACSGSDRGGGNRAGTMGTTETGSSGSRNSDSKNYGTSAGGQTGAAPRSTAQQPGTVASPSAHDSSISGPGSISR
ncbi:MAG: hypothetical protein H7222_03890 [Methylotenera sp.]|nr:hypothetical protein [Oligoflexia bacterium]